MERIPDQVADAACRGSGRQSPFYKPRSRRCLTTIAVPMMQSECRAWQPKLIEDTSIVPAYREFSNYFNDVYLPASS